MSKGERKQMTDEIRVLNERLEEAAEKNKNLLIEITEMREELETVKSELEVSNRVLEIITKMVFDVISDKMEDLDTLWATKTMMDELGGVLEDIVKKLQEFHEPEVVANLGDVINEHGE